MKRLLFGLLLFSFSIQIACENKTVLHESNSALQKSNSATVEKPLVSAPENLAKAIKAVEPFFQPMSKPQPDEWLATFKEKGQTFEQYINGTPTLPSAERKTIYIQPIGNFNKTQLYTIKLTAEYMQAFFNLPVKLLKEKTLPKSLSSKNSRINPFSKNKQVRTGYILEEILQPALPADAAALIGFTNEDLYPGDDFNYLFGQASFENRVGIWSLYRFEENADSEKFLKRTLKIAVHETGHMFSIAHCTKYECVMSGINHTVELDKRPIDACPECMAKICWMTNSEPETRYENLANFCKKYDLKIEAGQFIEKKTATSER